ncbi:hypothetical protein [Streptomyces eurocidicus]|uniref:Coenzyme F420-reducing hydrogenase gamma subunit n=1 Tax=Streptomyces eurocidicus TaxID=66423 RepID=A0A7W8BEU3_STREU|nr:hypothetical protein [Streptomyces eurocidicus]MBB5122080.1 coenzyme F420-reducing hydrogenase gamma subunit [Streptomyces eurocidicus]MBF6055413.1 hypothetical protein [Streptomyces eurocidicus]
MPTREVTEPQESQAPDLRYAVMDVTRQASTDTSTLLVEGSVVEVAEVEVVEEAG